MLTIYGNYGIIKQLKTRNNIRKNIVIKGDKIKSTGYVSTTQNKWRDMANSGANFVEIIKSTYSDSDLIQCYDENSSNNNNQGGNNTTLEEQ